MEPRRQESPESVKNEKKRFQIVKLEERVAPSHHSTTTSSVDTIGPPRGGGGNSGTLSAGGFSVQSRG
jgi:hypothetical protein